MVAKGADLTVFLTDEADKPLAAAGTKSARAIVQDGGKTATVPLQPAEPNRLVGTLGPAARQRSPRAVVSATLADGQAVQAQFVGTIKLRPQPLAAWRPSNNQGGL